MLEINSYFLISFYVVQNGIKLGITNHKGTGTRYKMLITTSNKKSKAHTQVLAYQTFGHAFYQEVQQPIPYVLLALPQWQSKSTLLNEFTPYITYTYFRYKIKAIPRKVRATCHLFSC